ncbi:hypothetical protein EMIHUDRAFT_214627 [Emiliania huxleyi CCMP1516]|uniref:Uncharacterized protein n=2 Tax=Emiliania huxleyi TaxID=2903 RepID=A0A0D3IJ86_EMIH1|nr:hypothetical protein EMIHUDRAFT_214627 [Emiliania huxleyi CCMP1516]EOD11321.1 hypothetical protein EMIHUDRAFT_214627 [Emiliania huxleyi CCMP1516]|eukprot:XP_005763750.1 hypothetical protein EMIHUDRAFT_214627 [Emiliania huxleyi CCMP1516]
MRIHSSSDSKLKDIARDDNKRPTKRKPRAPHSSSALRLSTLRSTSRGDGRPAGLGVQLQSASVARVLTRTVPPRRCGGARKADPTRQPPGACIQASATAGSAPARHDSGPRGVADGAESAPEARPAAGCARTTDVLPPLRPRSGPLVDTRNQQTPVSELLCRL